MAEAQGGLNEDNQKLLAKKVDGTHALSIALSYSNPFLDGRSLIL